MMVRYFLSFSVAANVAGKILSRPLWNLDWFG